MRKARRELWRLSAALTYFIEAYLLSLSSPLPPRNTDLDSFPPLSTTAADLLVKQFSENQQVMPIINENNQTFVAKRANAYRAFLIRQTHLPRLNNMRKCFCQKMIKMVNPGLYVKADSTCECT